MKELLLFVRQLNIQAVKKHRIDIIMAVILILGAGLFAQRPDIEAKIRLAKARGSVNTSAPKVEPKKVNPLPVEAQPVETTQPESYKSIESRNIFSPSGGYETTKELKRIPENPYNLIAILQGKEKRVVLREFTGDLVSVKVGSTLIDGGVIKQIGEKTVTIAKDDQVRELKIFDVKPVPVGTAAALAKSAGDKSSMDVKAAGNAKGATKDKGPADARAAGVAKTGSGGKISTDAKAVTKGKSAMDAKSSTDAKTAVEMKAVTKEKGKK